MSIDIIVDGYSDRNTLYCIRSHYNCTLLRPFPTLLKHVNAINGGVGNDTVIFPLVYC